MKEKFYAKSVKIAQETDRIIEVAEKFGIILPSTHTALFQSIYSPIEEPNLNGIRLGKEAVEKALPGLVSAQSNLEHLGRGFMTGIILDAFINDDNEIEIIFTFAKNLYPDEYSRAIELMETSDLSVSFELLSERDAQEILEDGTIRINDIDFQGVGLLLDNAPAYPNATVYQFAKSCKERLCKIPRNELICASQVERACDEILANEHEDEVMEEPILWTTITTRVDRHIHVMKIDNEGNGKSVGTFGDDEEPHEHEIMNYQIQKSKGHAHRLLEELLAKRKAEIHADKWSSDIYNNFPDSSFAVIEPAFLNGDTSNKKARHLPFKDRNSRFDLTNYRIALDKLDKILPVTNSITTEELRKSAKEELDKHSDITAKEHPDRGDVIFPAESSKVKDGKDHFPINTINQARNALARVAQFDSVPSWYDGTLSELVKKVKNAVKRKYPSINISIKANKIQGGVQFMTNEEKAKIKALRDELGDQAKDVKDEDLLDDAVIAELRKEIEKTKADADKKDKEAGDEDKNEDEGETDASDSEAEADSEAKDDADDAESEAKANEKAQDRITELEGKVEELENTLQAKDSEIETVRENAEKVGQMKVQLKDNEFAKDFKDEDYLNDEKVNEAIQSQKDAQTVATRKEELKDNKYAKDFKDEDYLNDDKVELAKVKAEKDELEANKETHNASEENDEAEADPDMKTGDADESKETSYEKVIASIRQGNKENQPKQKVYTRQK